MRALHALYALHALHALYALYALHALHALYVRPALSARLAHAELIATLLNTPLKPPFGLLEPFGPKSSSFKKENEKEMI